MSFCTNCDRETNAYSELDAPDGAPMGAMKMVRKCAECRVRLPVETTSTAPSGQMPQPAYAFDVSARSNGSKSAQNGSVKVADIADSMSRFARLAAAPQPSDAHRVAVPPLMVPSHDYAGMMREELVSLDAAQAQIEARRAYVRRVLAVLEPTTAITVDAHSN